ncbi:hypothetical protein A2Z67_02395 [Candidatus Woesebacteria bacterium RBG_13_36_22]|uniref:Uncharacterized protein n=1 Tax=Candidatus Woesebacteria bacterium RBG_13_36_22 TaxID=1802478 RepID=A0A1F7X157_9BACT|nr:MAG: hypothetical protein A2Z67_02395 [Candidatus Woesebacteria bacterium RBG_13_36_22]
MNSLREKSPQGADPRRDFDACHIINVSKANQISTKNWEYHTVQTDGANKTENIGVGLLMVAHNKFGSVLLTTSGKAVPKGTAKEDVEYLVNSKVMIGRKAGEIYLQSA